MITLTENLPLVVLNEKKRNPHGMQLLQDSMKVEFVDSTAEGSKAKEMTLEPWVQISEIAQRALVGKITTSTKNNKDEKAESEFSREYLRNCLDLIGSIVVSQDSDYFDVLDFTVKSSLKQPVHLMCPSQRMRNMRHCHSDLPGGQSGGGQNTRGSYSPASMSPPMPGEPYMNSSANSHQEMMMSASSVVAAANAEQAVHEAGLMQKVDETPTTAVPSITSFPSTGTGVAPTNSDATLHESGADYTSQVLPAGAGGNSAPNAPPTTSTPSTSAVAPTDSQRFEAANSANTTTVHSVSVNPPTIPGLASAENVASNHSNPPSQPPPGAPTQIYPIKHV